MKLRLIAKTEFFPQPEIELDTKEGSQALSEFAGRACYQSWDKPNPKTADNRSYLGHILDVGHASVLEHGSCSFYVEGVSRALTHEFIRHRHLSYSQLSQRFVGDHPEFVVPPILRGDVAAEGILDSAMQNDIEDYNWLRQRIANRLMDSGMSKTLARKRAREAARAVYPNMTETKIVVTGNHRAWRDFLGKRAEYYADLEIREFAVAVFKHLIGHFPNIYQDFEVFTDEDERQSVRLARTN